MFKEVFFTSVNYWKNFLLEFEFDLWDTGFPKNFFLIPGKGLSFPKKIYHKVNSSSFDFISFENIRRPA